eukprot:TRINITY_DN37082_c3_g1_i1.p1 TRINITY_DN37082_c3_g1~~TRINITY_DN37082_c3_g1_i1.p1  ORF type:complete len:512 (+),score=121.04 TRINITY_DN37082_c3_g1_i1:161-1696(+)
MWNSATSSQGYLTPRQGTRNKPVTPPHQPPPRSSSRGAPLVEDDASASRSRRVSAPTTDQKADEPMDPLELRQALAQREAALLRKDGEVFVLSAQVHQLKRQLRKAAQEASSYASQLSQALQIAESGGRALKADRAKALVSGAQRGLSRMANIHETNTPRPPVGGGALPRQGSSTGERSTDLCATGGSLNTDMTEEPPSPATSIATPTGSVQTPTGLHRNPSSGSRRGEARSPKRAGGDALEKERLKRQEVEARAKAQASTLEAAERRCHGLQAERDRAAAEASALRHEASELRLAHGEQLQRLTAELQRLKEGGTEAASVAASSATVVDDANNDAPGKVTEKEAASTTLQYNLQREFLRRVLRRCAAQEEELSNVRDDVTRRNVVIHNLRQEVQQQQAQVAAQFQQFQQQQQQQQLQEQQQQQQKLQQLHELQELQTLLQMQQNQLEYLGQKQPQHKQRSQSEMPPSAELMSAPTTTLEQESAVIWAPQQASNGESPASKKQEGSQTFIS